MYLEDRKLLARYLLGRNDPISMEPDEISLAETALRMQSRCATEFDFNYPDHLKPTPSPLNQVPDKSDPLPKSDIVVITWTADEVDALSDIFTCPYHIPVRSKRTTNDWYEYDRNFQSKFKNQIRKGAPSRGNSET